MPSVRTFQRRFRKRRYRRKFARKAVDRRQNRNISKLYKLVKYGKEKKFIDQINVGVAVGSTWDVLQTRDLTYIASGDTQNTRVANKCKIISHRIKILVTLGDTTNIYRIMIVRFPNQSTSLVALTDVLESTLAVSPANLMSMLHRNSDTKFEVLWDSGVKTLGLLTPQRSHDLTLRGKGGGFYTGYNSTSPGGCVAGYTYIVACTDSLLAPSPTFTTLSRTVFVG